MEAFVASLTFNSEENEGTYGNMFQDDGNDVFGGLMNAAASEAARYAFLTTDDDEEDKEYEDPLLYEEPQTISFHSHPLSWKIPYGVKNRWVCDICQSQHGGKKKGQAKESWHCGLCSFDLCHACFLYVRKSVNYEDGFMRANYGKERKPRSIVEMLPLKKPTTKSSTLLLEISSKEFLSSLSEVDSDTDDTISLELVDQEDSIDLKQISDTSIECLSLTSEDGSVQISTANNSDEIVHISYESYEMNHNQQIIDETVSQSRDDDSICSRTDIDSLSRTTDDSLSQGELESSISEEDVR